MPENDPWNPTPAQLAARRRRMKQMRSDLDPALPDWGDERDAPPVDEAAIESLYNDTASEEQQRAVAWLIFRYHSWARADVRLALKREGKLGDAQS
jgi:hypothetical protein